MSQQTSHMPELFLDILPLDRQFDNKNEQMLWTHGINV